MATMKTRIPEVLERHEAEILSDWMKEQATALTQRPDLMKESELRKESTKFLKLFREALASNNLIDIQQSIWEPVREFIGEVSRSRAIQGFSPSETATFVLSLKQPLFTRLRKIHEGQPDYLFEDLWNVTVLLDKLGLYSVEVFQKTREDVIMRQQEEMLELSTPVVKLWDGVIALPMIGTLDSARTQVAVSPAGSRVVSRRAHRSSAARSPAPAISAARCTRPFTCRGSSATTRSHEARASSIARPRSGPTCIWISPSWYQASTSSGWLPRIDRYSRSASSLSAARTARKASSSRASRSGSRSRCWCARSAASNASAD